MKKEKIKKGAVKSWLINNKDRFDDRKEWIKQCIEETGCSYNSVRKHLSKLWPINKKNDVNKQSNDKDIISSEIFLDGIDLVKQVIAFLDSVVKDGYIEDEKLRRRMDISRPKWKDICQLSIFDKRRFPYTKSINGQKEIVWSSENGIEKARARISMAHYE